MKMNTKPSVADLPRRDKHDVNYFLMQYTNLD